MERAQAARNTTDQAVLARIAVEDKHGSVRQAAAQRLTDQALLLRLAFDDPNPEVQWAAVGRLTPGTIGKMANQEQLYIVATRTKSAAQQAAFNGLTDQAVLTRLAVVPADSHINRAAAAKLTDKSLLARYALETDNPSWARVNAYDLLDDASLAQFATHPDSDKRRYNSLVLKIRNACQAIHPDHRTRLAHETLNLVHAILDPLIVSELGDIERIHIGWEHRSAAYQGGPPIDGEAFTLSVTMGRHARPFSHTWITSFAEKAPVPQVWKSASMSPEPLIEQVCDVLPQALLAQATKVGQSVLPCIAAAKLTDQELIAKLAIEEEGWQLRHAAVTNTHLTDQAVLARVAIEDKDHRVSSAACMKLTDQALLAKVARESRDRTTLCGAIEKLTNPEVLAKVAAENEDSAVRLAAAERLAAIRKGRK